MNQQQLVTTMQTCVNDLCRIQTNMNQIKNRLPWTNYGEDIYNNVELKPVYHTSTMKNKSNIWDKN